MLNLLETDQCDSLKKATLKYSFIPTACVRIKFDLHYSQKSTFKIHENFLTFFGSLTYHTSPSHYIQIYGRKTCVNLYIMAFIKIFYSAIAYILCLKSVKSS